MHKMVMMECIYSVSFTFKKNDRKYLCTCVYLNDLEWQILSYLFIYFWLHWVFVAVCRLSLVAASRGYSSLWCTGFSLWWLLLLQSMGSRFVGFSSCGSLVLECRLSNCGAWA